MKSSFARTLATFSLLASAGYLQNDFLVNALTTSLTSVRKNNDPRPFGFQQFTLGKQQQEQFTGMSRSTIALKAVPATLATNLAVDVASAAVTGLCVAPLITAFDEAITRSAAAGKGSGGSIWNILGERLWSIVTSPGTFFQSPAFRWMWLVYAATYLATNSIKTAEQTAGMSFGFAATLVVAIANMTCAIAKDSAYSRMFGSNGDQDKPITQKWAYIAWFVRDVTSFVFILTLPSMIASVKFPGLVQVPLGIAKFACPILAQYITTALHLFGLNMCNHPEEMPMDWLTRIWRGQYFPTVAARQLRIIPPYSIGGFLNGELLAMGRQATSLLLGTTV